MSLISSACGFTEPRKLTIINENSYTNGAFLISSAIGQRLRQQHSGVILICCEQTLKYYDTCGKRLGYNLSMAINKGSSYAIEPLRAFQDDVRFGGTFLEQLFDDIKEKVERLRASNVKHITIIIDDLTFPANYGFCSKRTIQFALDLYEFARERAEISLVIKVGLVNASSFSQHLSNNLEEFSDVLITVENMSSGGFWDVDGKLGIKKQKYENGLCNVESERRYLYKIGDSNVKLIAPGEMGLKF